MINDQKQSHIDHKTNKSMVVFGFPELSLFKDKPELKYLIKKTEKIVSAIHLVSNFLSDKEPIKWDLRSKSLELLTQVISGSEEGMNTSLVKVISLLEISFTTGLVSEMNYKILINELESVAQEMRKDSLTQTIGQMMMNQVVLRDNDIVSHNQSKGQLIMSDSVSIKKVKDNSNGQVNKTHNRQDIILGLLKKNKELGIKDFVSKISDCSEKTIQRELAALVAKGTLKKEGEKRWSRYSLK